MLSKVHHIAIICSDYARSKDFYTGILGFEIVNEEHRAERDSFKLDLRIGDHAMLELFSFPNPPQRPNRPEACGLRHLAFETHDLSKDVSNLESHGIAVEAIRVDAATGKRFTFFQDPDGLPLELYEA